MPRPLLIRILSHRRAVAGTLALLFAAIAIALFFPQLSEHYQQLFRLRHANSLGLYVSLAVFFVVACMTSIFPASILGVLAGMLLGLGQGLALAVGATMVSALLAFLFGRYFFRTVTRRLVAKILDLDKLERRLAQYGWRYALLVRLAPIAPFSITSYGLGLTPLTLREYLLTTLGSLPFLAVCVYLGSIGGVAIDPSGKLDGSVLRQLVLMFSAATVLGTIVVYLLPRIARRFLAPGDAVAAPRDEISS